MKIRTILLTLATLLAGVAVCFAADVNTGTWKLNEAKSKVAPEPRRIRWSSSRPWATG